MFISAKRVHPETRTLRCVQQLAQLTANCLRADNCSRTDRTETFRSHLTAQVLEGGTVLAAAGAGGGAGGGRRVAVKRVRDRSLQSGDLIQRARGLATRAESKHYATCTVGPGESIE